MTASLRFRVAVVGGGPAGIATALGLRRLGVDPVCIVSRGGGRRSETWETLPPDAGPVLAELGVRDRFDSLGFARWVGSAAAWGADTLGFNDFLFNLHGLGWHIERGRFDRYLRQEAEDRGVRVLDECSLVSVAVCGETSSLRVRRADGTLADLEADFMVDATGRAARLSRLLGARATVHDELVCVASTLTVGASCSLGSRCVLEATEHGWWYAAAFRRGTASVLFATDADLPAARDLRVRANWERALAGTRHISSALGGVAGAGRLIVRDARSATLDRTAGPRWLAVGDAAASHDPLLSQGVFSALVDGGAASRHVRDCLAGTADGSAAWRAEAVRRFESYRATRAHLYAQERSWADSPFWRRRGAAAAERREPALIHRETFA